MRYSRSRSPAGDWLSKVSGLLTRGLLLVRSALRRLWSLLPGYRNPSPGWPQGHPALILPDVRLDDLARKLDHISMESRSTGRRKTSLISTVACDYLMLYQVLLALLQVPFLSLLLPPFPFLSKIASLAPSPPPGREVGEAWLNA
jgi:hypothetical protein